MCQVKDTWWCSVPCGDRGPTNAHIQCNTIQLSCGVDLLWPAASTGSDLTFQLNIRVHFNPLVSHGWLDLLGQGTQIYKGGEGGFRANIGLCLP